MFSLNTLELTASSIRSMAVSPFHTVYHELGHAVQHMILDNNDVKRAKIDTLYKSVYSDIMGAKKWESDRENALKLAQKAKKKGFSYYGLRDPNEFVTESIAQYFLSDNPGITAKKAIQILLGE